MTRVLRKRASKVGKQPPGYGARGFSLLSSANATFSWNNVRYPIIEIITFCLCNSIHAYLEMNLVLFFFFIIIGRIGEGGKNVKIMRSFDFDLIFFSSFSFDGMSFYVNLCYYK